MILKHAVRLFNNDLIHKAYFGTDIVYLDLSSAKLHLRVTATSIDRFFCKDHLGNDVPFTVYDNGDGTLEVFSTEIVDKIGFGNSSSYNSTITKIEIIKMQTVTNLRYAFAQCGSLTEFVCPYDETKNVTDFEAAWQFCSHLLSIPDMNVSKGINFSSAWLWCHALTSFGPSNFLLAEDFGSAWARCYGLTSLPNLQTPNVAIFRQAWEYCIGLTQFPSIDTSSGTNFSSTWQYCSSLTSFPSINTSQGVFFNRAWHQCDSLTEFPQLDFSLGQQFDRTWSHSDLLESLPLINSTSGQIFREMVSTCPNLKCLGGVNTSLQTDTTDMFFSTSALVQPDAATINNILNGTNWVNPGACPALPLDLYLPTPPDPNSIFLDAFIASSSVPPGTTYIRIINDFTQPRIRTGNLTGLNVTLVNNGEIQGNAPGREALEVTDTLTVINNGWLRGAGGRGANGGRGGVGGAGGDSGIRVETQFPDTISTWVNTLLNPNAGGGNGWTFRTSPSVYISSPCGNQVSWNQNSYGTNATYRNNINLQLVNMCGNEGNESTPVFNYNSSGVYSISVPTGSHVFYKNQNIPGRSGGLGTGSNNSGSLGDYFGMGGYHPAGPDKPAKVGQPIGSGGRSSITSALNGTTYYGYYSGNSGTNGDTGAAGGGGTWGQNGKTGTAGSVGSTGVTSEDGNVGDSPEPPWTVQPVGLAGAAINGISNVVGGAYTGTGSHNGLIV